MPPALRRAALGFVAAAVAVLVAHQLVVLALHLAGQIPSPPYSMRPVAPWGVPAILNAMFWGGLWGVAFAFALPFLPARWPLWLAGVALGLLGPWLIGNGLVMPLVRGGPLLFGLSPASMWRGALILGAFGAAWAYLFALLERRRVLA